jgi:hypothetical protein
MYQQQTSGLSSLSLTDQKHNTEKSFSWISQPSSSSLEWGSQKERSKIETESFDSDGSSVSATGPTYAETESLLSESYAAKASFHRPVYATLNYVGKKSAVFQNSLKTENRLQGTQSHSTGSQKLTPANKLLSKLKNFRKPKTKTSSLKFPDNQSDLNSHSAPETVSPVQHLVFCRRCGLDTGYYAGPGLLQELLKIDLQQKQFSSLQKLLSDRFGGHRPTPKNQFTLDVLNVTNAHTITAYCLSAASKNSNFSFHYQNPQVQSVACCIKSVLDELMFEKRGGSDAQTAFSVFERHRYDVLCGLQTILAPAPKKKVFLERETIKFDAVCVYVLVCIAASPVFHVESSQDDLARLNISDVLLDSRIEMEETDKGFQITAAATLKPQLLSNLYLLLCKNGVYTHLKGSVANSRCSLSLPSSCEWISVEKQCFNLMWSVKQT